MISLGMWIVACGGAGRAPSGSVERTSEMIDLQAAHTIRSIGSAVSNSGKTEGLLDCARAVYAEHPLKTTAKLVNFINGTLDLTTLQLREVGATIT